MNAVLQCALAQIYPSEELAKKAALSKEVGYALESRAYKNDIYYTYIYCTADMARKLLELKSIPWHLAHKSDFAKNHPGFMVVSVPYTKAETLLPTIEAIP